jgi:LPXTG-motif cell wall-anchored protein
MVGGTITSPVGITFKLMQGTEEKYRHEIAAEDFNSSEGKWKVVFDKVDQGVYTLVESGYSTDYKTSLNSSNDTVTIDSTNLTATKNVTNTYNHHNDNDEPIIDVPDEQPPAGPAVTPTPAPPAEEPGEVITDEEVPNAPAKLPKTGEVSPALFYTLGLAVSALGLGLRKRK